MDSWTVQPNLTRHAALRNLRVAFEVSLRDVAERTGWTPAELSEIERGTRTLLPSEMCVLIETIAEVMSEKTAASAGEE